MKGSLVNREKKKTVSLIFFYISQTVTFLQTFYGYDTVVNKRHFLIECFKYQMQQLWSVCISNFVSSKHVVNE